METQEFSFHQDPKYITAVKELRKDYLAELQENQKGDTKSDVLQNLLMKGTALDFNSFRKAVKSLSNSQSSLNNESGSNGRSIEGALTQGAEHLDKRRYDLIDKIENVIAHILKDISNGKHPKLILRNQKLWSNCLFEERISLKPTRDAQMVTVRFSSANSRDKFSLILHILSVVHQMILKRSTCTRRELYYQNVNRVKNQSAIDSAVRDLCCLLQVPPWDLGLLATSKGLMAGPLSFKTSCGHSVSCMGAGGVLVPQDVINITAIESAARFILVVEKDAIFQKLLDEGALERLGPCIMITGKGYPDVNTRLMLKLLVETLKIPSFALVDADPHGIEIMCTYRFGSLAMSHLSQRLAVPSIRWLGVHPSDISRLGAPGLELSSRDVAKARDLLARPYCDTNAALRHQLQLLQENGLKTEIEGIGTMSQAYLTDRDVANGASMTSWAALLRYYRCPVSPTGTAV